MCLNGMEMTVSIALCWPVSWFQSFNLEEPNCSKKPWLEKKKELQKGF